MYLILLPLLFFIILFFSTGYLLSVPGHKGKNSDHFNGRKFINPGGIKPKGFKEVFRWMMNRRPGLWAEIEEKARTVPEKRITDKLVRITFVNHSTFLIQAYGVNIITDPIWGRRASPFSWMGPKRKRPPGVALEELPPVDIILLSHNHYDHLDIKTLKYIKAKFNPLVITALGVPRFLVKHGFRRYEELDWWENTVISDQLKITSVPAQHFSGRGMFDKDNTLWCGFVIDFPSYKIYFAGDTGYGNFIKEIGEKCGPFRVSLLPIGAYIPQWFMQPIHTSPEEAVKIHMDSKSVNSIATHFGTFPLADDGMNQPTEDLAQARLKYGISADAFIFLKEGDFTEYN